jgi:hypothetical protein
MTIADEGIVDGESDGIVDGGPEVPAKDTLPALVSVPSTDTTAIDPARVVVPSPPSIATPPPLVEPSPELRLRVKLPLLLVGDDPAVIEEDPPDSPEDSLADPPECPEEPPAVRLNDPSLSLPEPTEVPELSPDPGDGFPPRFTPPGSPSSNTEGLGVASRLRFESRSNNIGMITPVV